MFKKLKYDSNQAKEIKLQNKNTSSRKKRALKIVKNVKLLIQIMRMLYKTLVGTLYEHIPQSVQKRRWPFAVEAPPPNLHRKIDKATQAQYTI